MSIGLTQLQKALSECTGWKYVFLVGSGTAAIAIALRALRIREGGKVVVPAMVCPHVCYGVVLSGLEPSLCDISCDDFTIDVNALRKKIMAEGHLIKAVLPVHLFGYTANMKEVEKICYDAGIPIIEDAAQTMGGSCGEKQLGSFGDVSILSFGYSKIIDVGGGGAILTNNRELAENIKGEIDRFPSKPISNKIRHIVKILLSFLPLYNAILWFMKRFPFFARKIYFYPMDATYADRVYLRLKELKAVARRRRENVHLYEQMLSHKDVTLPLYQKEEGIVWRYSILLRDHAQRERVLQEARREGLSISKLYKPLHHVFTHLQSDGEGFPIAEDVGNRIVNLPVNPALEKEKIVRMAKAIIKTLEH